MTGDPSPGDYRHRSGGVLRIVSVHHTPAFGWMSIAARWLGSSKTFAINRKDWERHWKPDMERLKE